VIVRRERLQFAVRVVDGASAFRAIAIDGPFHAEIEFFRISETAQARFREAKFHNAPPSSVLSAAVDFLFEYQRVGVVTQFLQ
jgi:hypothetical protein